VMAMAFGSQYRQFLQSFQGSQQPFWQGESETFGINHALAGQLLLSRWKLPAPFTHAVAAHHDPELAEVADPLARRFWRVLTLAHTGALLFLGQCQADVFVLASELARRHLNWTAQRLGEVLEMAEPICRERTIMLGTPTDQAVGTLTGGGWTGKIRAASAACK